MGIRVEVCEGGSCEGGSCEVDWEQEGVLVTVA